MARKAGTERNAKGSKKVERGEGGFVLTEKMEQLTLLWCCSSRMNLNHGASASSLYRQSTSAVNIQVAESI